MTKAEYLTSLIERTESAYHRSIYQSQLDRILGLTPKNVWPAECYNCIR